MRFFVVFHINYSIVQLILPSTSVLSRNLPITSRIFNYSHILASLRPGNSIRRSLFTAHSHRRLSGVLSLMTFHMNEMEMKKFDAVFGDVVNTLTNDILGSESEIKSVVHRLKEVIDYNVPHGKKTRGLFVVKAYREFCGSDKILDDDVYLAQVLGWCVEMLQAYFLVSDDLMDQSQTRRGQLCWYKKEGVGLIAVNDVFSLEAALYILLKKYFHNKPYYVNVMELFHEITFQTVMGQSLDLLTSSTTGELDFEKFTVDTYNAIVKYKTAYYSFYLPIALALYMAGITDPKIHEKAKKVLLEMGNLFQVQDDYIDCFGDPAITGKIGTDIEDGKCSWLVVTALRLASPEQTAVIRENYRQSDPVGIAKVKDVYEKLQLPFVYEVYEEEQYNNIVKLIGQLEPDVSSNIFRELANAIYKRKR